LFIRQQTSVINAIRAHLAEFGIVAPVGRHGVEQLLGVDGGSLAPTPTLVGLGCPLLFHAGASFGVPITEHWRVLGTFEHLSNGKPLGVDCGTNQRPGGNQGLERLWRQRWLRILTVAEHEIPKTRATTGLMSWNCRSRLTPTFLPEGLKRGPRNGPMYAALSRRGGEEIQPGRIHTAWKTLFRRAARRIRPAPGARPRHFGFPRLFAGNGRRRLP
jgi:hypothetical protein